MAEFGSQSIHFAREGARECHGSAAAETLTLERTSGGQAVAVFAFLADRLVFLAGLAW